MGRMKNAFKVMLGVAAVAVTLLTGTKEVKAEEPNWFYVELAEGSTEATVNARGLGSEYEYTFDLINGTWQDVTEDDISLSTPSNTKVYFRAKRDQNYTIIPGGNSFKTKIGSVKIGGDILTLFNQDPSQAQMGSNAFQQVFRGCKGIVDASQLKLPNYVTTGCYKHMFRDCTSLKSAPKLPATALAEACYHDMFYNCSSLTTVPDLPATTLAENCYNFMFGDCIALTKAPKLPATELVSGCYSYMFKGCTNLNEVHVGLTSLEGVTDTSLEEWLNGVSSSGTLYCPQSLIDEAEASGSARDYLCYPETWILAVEKPTPEPSPKPSPEPSPQPSPQPSPEPSPEPSPKPSPEPKFEDPTVTFKDVAKGKWYSKTDGPIAYVVAYGIMNGTGDGTTFDPEGDCTREVFVQILYNMEGEPGAGSSNPFKDVKSGKWYYDAVTWALANDVTKGTSADIFGIGGKVTREQLAQFLMNYAKKRGYDTSARTDISKFPDNAKVSGWAKEAISWANANGIVNGKAKNGANYLDPKGNATRAEAAQMIMNFQKEFGR